MRYDGLYVDVKRMALALEGLIRREYPGDYLQFVEMSSFAKPRHISEIAALMPKPVTVIDSVVRLRADMSDPGHQRVRRAAALHQHPARTATGPAVPGRSGHAQPAGHLDHRRPADRAFRRTTSVPAVSARSADRSRPRCARGWLCHRDGITINIFLLPSWSQSREDVQFAYRLAETTAGRVFFTAGKDLDRYVVWDYLHHRREIVA